MSGDQKRQLEQQLWNIANELRGKMNADEFRDYILGFIFYKYLSEKQSLYANQLLKGEKTEDYRKLTDPELLAAIKNESLETLGYFLEPGQLFDALAKKGNSKEAKSAVFRPVERGGQSAAPERRTVCRIRTAGAYQQGRLCLLATHDLSAGRQRHHGLRSAARCSVSRRGGRAHSPASDQIESAR